jgi:hypothetical protein
MSGKNCFFNLLNVETLSDVREMEIHIAESLVTDPSTFEVVIVVTKLKCFKSPGSDEILAELI